MFICNLKILAIPTINKFIVGPAAATAIFFNLIFLLFFISLNSILKPNGIIESFLGLKPKATATMIWVNSCNNTNKINNVYSHIFFANISIIINIIISAFIDISIFNTFFIFNTNYCL